MYHPVPRESGTDTQDANKSLAVTPKESSPILERNEAAPQEAKDANQSTTKGKL